MKRFIIALVALGVLVGTVHSASGSAPQAASVGPDHQHGLGARRARRRPAVGVGADPAGQGQEGRLQQRGGEVGAGPAVRHPQRLQAVAAGRTRRRRSDHERVRHRAQRRRRAAQRDVAGDAPLGADGSRPPSSRGSSSPTRPRGPGSLARPRERGVDAGRRGGERRRRREGRDHRQRHRRHATRASTTPATPRSRSSAIHDLTNNKVIVAKVFDNKVDQERLRRPRRSTRTAPTSPAPSPATPTRRRRRRRRHPVRPVRRRAAGAARQLQRLPRRRSGRARSRGHPRRARGGLRRRLRRRQHEPRRRPQRRRRRVPARQRGRQPRPGQHGRRRRRRQRGPGLLHRRTTRVLLRARSPPAPARSGTASSTSSTVAGADYEVVIGEFARARRATSRRRSKVVSDPASGFPHGLNLACDDSPPLPDLTGKIALLGRGTCDFTVKMRNAQNAGAVGVVMVDRDRRRRRS